MDMKITPRCLLGPGPSNIHPRVLQSMCYPLIGHLDPQFLDLMNGIQRKLRPVFQTENEMTMILSGTGMAGMEAAFANFVEPGDSVLVCVKGFFGERMVELASRYGADVSRLDRTWGEIFTLEDIRSALEKKPAKVVAIVHGETSTGALQPMEGIADLVHAQGGLLMMDCVTTLGGLPVAVDAWGVDVAYSGSQKCMGVPSGVAPITVSPRAREVLASRKSKVSNFYLDLAQLGKYWGKERAYHHTAPINMYYAFYEGLCLIEEEGLKARWERHQRNAQALWMGLEHMGLKLVVPASYRLPSLTTVYVPEGVQDLDVRRKLLNDYNIEISGGFGIFAGKIWRIGLMGYSSQPENVTLLLGALREILAG
jgi:alanine-glyoxylate transaminase/serine-glyoxylate transaminase/serine-pyruvate transaminase